MSGDGISPVPNVRFCDPSCRDRAVRFRPDLLKNAEALPSSPGDGLLC